MSAVLLLLCALLLGAAAREQIGSRGGEGRTGPRVAPAGSGPLERVFVLLAIDDSRLASAGIRGRIDPAWSALGRLVLVSFAAPIGLAIASALPGRTGLVVAIALPAVAAVAPELVLGRLARRRRELIRLELPAVLDLMATAADAGRGGAALIVTAAERTGGALGAELGLAAVDLSLGRPGRDVLADLGRRGGPELAALAALLDRSRRLGVPLATALRDQAEAQRQTAGRKLSERADRAAPKIQLVVALVLVPSVLLILCAALLAHGDSFLGGL